MAPKKDPWEYKSATTWIVPSILERLEKLPDKPRVVFEAEVDFRASNTLFVCHRGDT